MQQYVTKDDLITLGINLTNRDVDSLLTHLNATIEERIGAEITEELSDEQLDEMIAMQDSATDEELSEWIAKNVPEYIEIVQDTIDMVVGELAQGADTINTTVS